MGHNYYKLRETFVLFNLYFKKFFVSFLETALSLDVAESTEDWFTSSVRYVITVRGGALLQGRTRSNIYEEKTVLGNENLHVVWGR